jgi:hypothetical protein
MTKEEAKEFLYSIAGNLGLEYIENYTSYDGRKMREAIKTLDKSVKIVRCKDCKHRPVKTDTQIVPPNGMRDETCPCINADDWWYSYMPEGDFFCADGERKE